MTGKVTVWCRSHEALDPKCIMLTFKSARQSLMVWSCITSTGIGTMLFCSGSMTGVYYRALL